MASVEVLLKERFEKQSSVAQDGLGKLETLINDCLAECAIDPSQLEPDVLELVAADKRLGRVAIAYDPGRIFELPITTVQRAT